MLQQLLDEAKSSARRFETQYLEAHQRNLALEEEVEALGKGTVSDE